MGAPLQGGCAGSLKLDQPLPTGDLSLDGTWTWRRSTEDHSLAVPGRQGTLVLTWSGRGTDPARRWLESLT